MLPTFSKIFEKLIHKELTNFLAENNVINESQYGFRKKHSTFHALAHATENIYASLNKKLHTLGIFVDYSRAFDTVSHSILLKKLSTYGIRGNMLKLLTSYLSNRKQYVSYGGRSSTLLDITIGVPQGSVLGPLLFIIFVNDIVNVSHLAKFVLFADDLNLFLSHQNRDILYEQANEILGKLMNYCKANMLIINFEKCCYIEFKPDINSDVKFLGINDEEFEKVEECKFLGVRINQDMSWNDQLQNVIGQVAKACGSMYTIRTVVPQKILKKIYMALVQPYLIYCTLIWGSEHSTEIMDKLFKLQKKCIRIVTNSTSKVNGMFQHTKPLFRKIKVLTIFNIYYYMSALEAMKIMNSKSPPALFSFYNISERSKRLIPPKFNLTRLMNKSFIYKSSKLLNHLITQDIKYYELPLSIFKKRLKRHLLFLQSLSRAGDSSWLPCNHHLFSDVHI